MSTSIIFSQFALMLPLSAAHKSAPTTDCAIHLIDLPPQVVVPTAQGWNLFLTVKVTCPDIRNVWLARSDTSLTRLVLMKQGDLTYQLNLGAPEVRTALQTNDREPTFTIFAESAGGAVIRSLPVSYVIAPNEYARSKLFVVTPTGRQEPAQRWFVPNKIERVELEITGPPSAPYMVKLESGGESAPCERDRTRELAFVCPINDELRETWRRDGRLRVSLHGLARDNHSSHELLRIPEKLNLGHSSARFQVSQRAGADLPGSLGFIRVRAGDVTMGQVPISVETAYGEVLLHPTSMRHGSTARFNYLMEEYVLEVEELVNRLFEGDYVSLSAASAPQWESQAIDKLLSIIEKSPVAFLRDGNEYTGAQAAEHLRSKRYRQSESCTTLNQFIDNVASRSSTGQTYQVKLSDGTLLDAATWYRQQLGLSPAPQKPSTLAKETP